MHAYVQHSHQRFDTLSSLSSTALLQECPSADPLDYCIVCEEGGEDAPLGQMIGQQIKGGMSYCMHVTPVSRQFGIP